MCLVCLGSGGCVHAYQPMTGMQTPIVIDPQQRNFEHVELDLYCQAGDHLDGIQAGVLCGKVATLFEVQGAIVHPRVDSQPPAHLDEPDDTTGEPRDVRLTVELRARQTYTDTHQLSWLICLGSLTFAPGIVETTFAQDVVISDDSGFLLLSDTLEGRLVRRFGIGPWVGNGVLNLLWRDDEDKLTEEAVSQDVSRDLYGQLSQLVFNASMRAEVLRPVVERSEATADGEGL